MLFPNHLNESIWSKHFCHGYLIMVLKFYKIKIYQKPVTHQIFILKIVQWGTWSSNWSNLHNLPRFVRDTFDAHNKKGLDLWSTYDDDGDDPNKSGDDDHVYVYHRHGDATPADTPTVTIIINGIYCISWPGNITPGRIKWISRSPFTINESWYSSRMALDLPMTEHRFHNPLI